MTLLTKTLKAIFAGSLFALTSAAFGANQIVTDCNATVASTAQSIQSKINSMSAGDELFFDCAAGSFNNTLQITKGITIRGRGKTGQGANATFLTKFNVNGAQIFNVSVPAGAAFRLTGIEFTGNPGEPLIDLDGHFGSLRVDNCGFTEVANRSFRVGYNTRTGGTIEGVFDNNVFTNSASQQFMLYYGNDSSWEQPELYGTSKAIYFEDNVFSWGTPGPNSTPCDGEHGARFVIRRNIFTNAQFQWHDTGSTQEARATRYFEIYDNILNCNKANCGWGAVGFRGGTGVFFNNILPVGTNGYENASVSQIWRADQNGSYPWQHRCDGIVDRICSNFLKPCSSNADCPSGTTCLAKVDGHKDSLGWPCRDQTGRGQDNPVTHEQRSAPLYWWSVKTPSGVRLDPWMANDEYIKPDRDYYYQRATFNGSSGVGVGPLSARPNSCRGPINDVDGYEITKGVAYWATDQNILYHCTATNSWAILFTPFTYPHPLRQGSNPGTPPAPPRNLAIN